MGRIARRRVVSSQSASKTNTRHFGEKHSFRSWICFRRSIRINPDITMSNKQSSSSWSKRATDSTRMPTSYTSSTSSSSNSRNQGEIPSIIFFDIRDADPNFSIPSERSQLQTYRDTKPRVDPWSAYTMRTSTTSDSRNGGSSRL